MTTDLAVPAPTTLPLPRLRPTARIGTGLVLAAAAGFGISSMFAKQSYQAGISVQTMLSARFALAAAVFWIIVAVRRPAIPAARTLLIAVGLGGIGYALQATLYFGAVARIDASLAGLLLYLYPTLVVALAVVLRRERPDRRRWAALGTSAVGLLLILGTGAANTDAPVATTGVLLALGAALTYALYLTAADGLPADLDLYLLSAVVCTAAAATLTVAGLAGNGLTGAATASGWIWVAMLAIFSTVLPIAAMFAGMRLVGASAAALLSCVEPAVTTGTSILFYGERLTGARFAGGALILAAVVVLRLRRKPGTDRSAESPVQT